MTVHWSDEVDDVLASDLAALLSYATPAGGAVVTPVSPIGLRDREAGTVGFTTSIGFGRKLERIRRDPRMALSYHAREHGFSRSGCFVHVQGTATPRRLDPAALHRELGARRGHRRAGQAMQQYTGWLTADRPDAALYAPHTAHGFRAPANKTLLLLVNGLLAKKGMRDARRPGAAERR